jgi:hypothetical protein
MLFSDLTTSKQDEVLRGAVVGVNFSQVREIRAADYTKGDLASEALLYFSATDKLRLVYSVRDIIDVLNSQALREPSWADFEFAGTVGPTNPTVRLINLAHVRRIIERPDHTREIVWTDGTTLSVKNGSGLIKGLIASIQPHG